MFYYWKVKMTTERQVYQWSTDIMNNLTIVDDEIEGSNTKSVK